MKVCIWLLAAIASHAQVSVTLGSGDITALSYNGQSWLGGGLGYPYSGPVTIGVNEYGYLSPDVKTNTATKTTHVYRNGLSDSFTVEVTYTAGSDTLQCEFVITNNSTTGAMTLITLRQFVLQTPSGTVTSKPVTNSIGSEPDAHNPVATLYGPAWSFAAWNANVSTYGNFNASFSSDGQSVFGWALDIPSFISPGPSPVSIAANGGTWSGTLVMKFADSVVPLATLTGDGNAAYRAQRPASTSQPDRRPWGEWFVSGYQFTGPTNPRGYWNDYYLDALDPVDFAVAMQTFLDAVIAQANSMSPRPQGIIIWDVEGQEFDHAMTYIGKPSLLSAISPEMNTPIDSISSQLRAAGYKIAFTLRPMKILTGTTLPSTCTTNATYIGLRDVFVKTDATPPNRGYRCDATNTWSQVNLQTQTVQQTATEVLTILRAEIDNAVARWGASAFYVDSTVNYLGQSITTTIWATLKSEYPSIEFFPENTVFTTIQSGRPFSNGQQYGLSQEELNLYPDAWSYHKYESWDGSTSMPEATASIARGDVPSCNIWYPHDCLTRVSDLYSRAAALNAIIAMTDRGQPRTFNSAPGTSFTYPVTARVYFASSSGDLAASTTYCTRRATDSCYLSGVLQSTAALDLSALPYYQIRYYDFAGNLVSNPGTYGVIQ